MARIRQIYAGDLVFVGPTGVPGLSTGSHFNYNGVYGDPYSSQITGVNLLAELFRIQKVDYDYTKTLKDVVQYGDLGRIDAVPLEQPTVNISFDWILSNLVNEDRIGLTVSSAGATQQTSCISGYLYNQTSPRDIFVVTTPEGQDAIGSNISGNSFVISLGNSYISNYTVSAKVGDFATANTRWECLNIQGQTFTGQPLQVPAINQASGLPLTGWCYLIPAATESDGGAVTNSSTSTYSALRPGDITFSLGLGVGDGFALPPDLKVQDVNFTINLTRERIMQLGSKYDFAKVLKFPMMCDMTVNAI